MRRSLSWSLSALFLSLVCFSSPVWAMLKTRTIKKEPAIVLTAFGTTTRAAATYRFFEEQLRAALPAKYKNIPIKWAFTSEIVRERANRKFAKAGRKTRFRSLEQVIANLEDQGYRKIAVQPLHIFPGIEYDSLLRQVDGLRRALADFHVEITVGTPLFQYWEGMDEALAAISKDFLPPEQGCNVLVTHGTEETANPANITYLGLDRMVRHRFSNAVVGSVEGIVTRESALSWAKRCPKKRVRFIPLMFVAGDHIMHDIMGTRPNPEGLPSWAMEMRAAGFQVEATTTVYRGEKYYKGLGFSKEIDRIFVESLIRALERLEE